MFRIVKGGIDELSADLQAKAVGVRTFPTGFEALVKPRILAHLLHWTLNRLPLTKSLCLQARKVRIMSNILKATRLDFSLVKPYVKVIGFTMLLPIAFAAINRSILTGVSFAMCFIAMTTGYTFSVTEKIAWNAYMVFCL